MKSINASLLVLGMFLLAGCGAEPTTSEGASDQPTATAAESPPAKKTPAKPAKVDRKLLLFGVDGATWKLMDPLLEQGKLPHFKKLIESGVRSPLATIKPTVSPLLWTTIATGFGPGKHGIHDFVAKAAETGETRLVTSNMRKVKALWNILSESDYTVGVTGWWATYPAEQVKGFVISDQAISLRKENYEAALEVKPDDRAKSALEETHPPALNAEIQALIADSPKVGLQHIDRFMKLPAKKLAKLKAEQKVDKEDMLSVFSFALRIDQAFIESGLYATGQFNPDFNAVYLAGLDHAAEHPFWKYIEPDKFKGVEKIPRADIKRYENVINAYYIYMDEVLGRFLDLYKNDDPTVVVVSDHGHEANVNYDPKSDDHFNRNCSGDHEQGSPDGILILSGKDILPGANLHKMANIGDITPTVLALIGVPVGRDMPGRVIDEAIDPAFLKAHPVTYVPSHSAGYTHSAIPAPSRMNQELLDKLKAIGYIQ